MKIKPKPNIEIKFHQIPFAPFSVTLLFFQTIVAFFLLFITNVLPLLLKYYGFDKDVKQFAANTSYAPLFSLIVFLAGIQLFKFKERHQFWYGICEVGFAISSYGYFLRTIQPKILTEGFSPLSLFSLITSLYLIVRGYANVKDGINKDDYWRKSMIQRLYRKEMKLRGRV